jgi:hypothetical protein
LALIRLFAFLILFAPLEVSAQPEFHWQNGNVTSVTFTGLERNIEEKLTIKTSEGRESLAGKWTYYPYASFRPAVPFRHGQVYHLDTKDRRVLSFTIPALNDSFPPSVLLLPHNDTLPANHLKLYLVFNQSMKEGGNMDLLELWDLSNGRKVSRPFLDLQPELWNYSGDTLTVWFDPGRIKRELIPNKTMGPVLHPGRKYEIRVLPGMMNALGVPIKDELQITFIAGVEDRSSPVPSQWEISRPKSGTAEVLSITFDEPLDPVTVLNYALIKDDKGDEFPGSYSLSHRSDTLYFKPLKNWQKGSYTILFDPKIEDFSGNRFNRLFDHEGESAPALPAIFQIHVE